MIALLGGLGAALFWALSTLCNSRSTRMVGAASSLAWIMTFGLVLGGGAVAIVRPVFHPSTADWWWLTAEGLGSAIGFLFILLALKVGKVSLAAPIVATEGAAAAVISIFFGEKVVAAVILGLAVIVIGVVLASTGEKSTSPLEAKARFETVLFAVLGAIIAGSSLYSTGQISADVAPLWRAMAPRVFGVVLIAVPLLVSRKLKLSKKALPLLAIAAVCELGGWISYAVGSTHSVAVAAVVSSQFAAIAAVAAFFVFKERLTRMQTVGVVCVIAGVTVVSLFSH